MDDMTLAAEDLEINRALAPPLPQVGNLSESREVEDICENKKTYKNDKRQMI